MARNERTTEDARGLADPMGLEDGLTRLNLWSPVRRRTVQRAIREDDPQSALLMHALGENPCGMMRLMPWGVRLTVVTIALKDDDSVKPFLSADCGDCDCSTRGSDVAPVFDVARSTALVRRTRPRLTVSRAAGSLDR